MFTRAGIRKPFVDFSQAEEVLLRRVLLPNEFAPSLSHHARQLWAFAEKSNGVRKLGYVPHLVQQTGFSFFD